MTEPNQIPDEYPGSYYQRLFNAIHDTGGLPLEDEMCEIIRIVHKYYPIDNPHLLK